MFCKKKSKYKTKKIATKWRNIGLSENKSSLPQNDY